MKKIYIVFLFSLISLFTNELKATHMMGGDITYTCVSPGVYKIIIKVYRDCRGIPFNSPSITFFCVDGNSSGSQSLNYTRTAINDLTPTCSSGTNPCNPQNTPAQEGIEEHVFEATVDFNSGAFKQMKDAGCCKFKMQVSQCCRNGAITTISPGNFYTDAYMDICNIEKSSNKCNTSPQLSIPPVAYLCCNQPFTFNNGVREVVDGDSLSYELSTPLNGNNSNENYTGNFNSSIPMTPFCPPNPGVVNCRALPNAKPPRGFYFDKETGDIVFTPTKCDEVGIIVIQVNEWRINPEWLTDKKKTKWLLIGFTRRDMQLIVKTCPDNNPPYFTGSNKYGICEGSKICFKIQSKDDPFLPNQTRPDSTYLTWNNGIPGATFTIVDPTAREKQAEFCWQTKIGDARPNPYSFTATAKDDACPKPAQSNKGYNVTVAAKARDTRKYTLLECGKFKFNATPFDTVNYEQKNYRYKYTIRDSTNSGRIFFLTFNKADSFKFQAGGKYIIEHEINNPPFNCPTIYLDTVIIPPVLDVKLKFGRDTFVCAGNSLTIEPVVSYGVPTYQYRWEVPLGTVSSNTTNKVTVTPTSNMRLGLRLTDNNKCVDVDTVTIKVIKNPVVNIGPDRRICTYDFVTLDAQNADSLMYEWSTGDNTREITINVAGRYSVKVLDSIYRCHASDTMQLFVNDTVIALTGGDREICVNDTLKVRGQRRPKGYSRQITWRDLNTGGVMANDSSFNVRITSTATRNYEMYLRVNQGGVTCENKDTFNLVVNPLPTFQFAGLPPRCYQDGAINLTTNVIARARAGFDPTIVVTDLRYFQEHKTPRWVTGGPVGVNTYVYDFPRFITNDQVPKAGLNDIICYDYRDAKGCYNKECRNIRLNPNPVVELKTGTFCQKAGPVDLSKLVVKPFSKVGGIENFKCLEVPNGSGVDKDAIVWLDNSVVPPVFRLEPGLEGENQKTGDYQLEYCFTDVLTGCKACDSIYITIVRLPEIEFSALPKQCVNFPFLSLDSFAKDRNTGKRFVDGVWSTVEFRNSRDMSIPVIASAINNSVKSNKLFDPGHATPLSNGAGQYLLKLYDESSGCPVADSAEITVNGLPLLRINIPDTVCSSSAPFALNNEQPSGSVGTWSGVGVIGRDFNPGVSPKTKQYEDPIRLKFEYTNPLTGCTDSIAENIRIQSQPEVTITTPKPYQQCEGIPFNITATKQWASNTNWSGNGDGSFSVSNALTTIYTHGIQDTAVSGSNGNVMLSISTIKEGVCPTAKDDIQLMIEPYPQFTMPHHFVQCEAATIDFSSRVFKPEGSPNLRYTWYFGNGDTLRKSNLSNPQKVYDTAKRDWYDVTLIVHNQWGSADDQACSTQKDSLDYVRVLPQPKAGFSSDPGFFTTVAFPKFKFKNETQYRWGAENMSYLWSFDLADLDDTSTQINPIKSYPSDTTVYWVNLQAKYTYYAANDITIDEDVVCEDSIGYLRKIGPDVTVFVPTAFSPERTGPKSNNVFRPIVNGEKTYYVMLFNRWGEILWESYDKFAGWDGTYRGEDAQQDVYIWHVKVTGADNVDYHYEGTVSLMR
jgi:gliding motility-associated-like protein